MTGTIEVTREGEKTYVQWHGPHGKVEITTEEMDHLIGVLASWRGLMQPEVPMTLPQAGQVATYLAIINPPYWVQPTILDGCALMHLRHPAFGWLSFHLPRDESQRVSELLLEIAAAPPRHLGPRQ